MRGFTYSNLRSNYFLTRLTTHFNYMYRRLKEQEIKLLDKVHIQLDNTARENKNKFVVGFCTWLVEVGLATEIRLSFNPVG